MPGSTPITLAAIRSVDSSATRSSTRPATPATNEAGARRSAIAALSRASVVPVGASNASAAAGVTLPETMRTAAAVAGSVGSGSFTISTARAPPRRAAISFSSRDDLAPTRNGGVPLSASATRSRTSTPAQSSYPASGALTP